MKNHESSKICLRRNTLSDKALKKLCSLDLNVHNPPQELGFAKLSILNGHIIIDDNVLVPLTIHNGNIMWKRFLINQDASGVQTSITEIALLKMSPHGLHGRGFVIRNGEKIPFDVLSTNKYTMKLSSGDTNESVEIGILEMGYKAADNGFVAYGSWEIPYLAQDIETGQLITDHLIITSEETSSGINGRGISFFIDDRTSMLSLVADFNRVMMEQIEVLSNYDVCHFKMSFNNMYDNVNGKAYSRSIVDNKLVEKEKGTISGILADTHFDTVEKVGRKIKALTAARAVLTKKDLLKLAENEVLSVIDLYNLPRPQDLNAVHEQAFNRLLHMAVYAADKHDPDVFQYLGMARPTVDDAVGDLTREQAKIADNKICHTFLTEEFAISYLSYAYSKNNESKISKPITNIKGYEEKLKYFMQGTDNGCMVAKDGYKKATGNLYSSVYKNNVPGLNNYIRTQKENDWAKQLYEFLLDPVRLNGIVATNLIHPGDPLLTHYYTILDILDDSPRVVIDEEDETQAEKKLYSLSNAFRKQVMDVQLKNIFESVILPSPDDTEGVAAMNEFVTGFLQEYFNAIQDGSFGDWDAASIKEAQEELLEMAKYLQYENTEAMIADISSIATNFTAAMLRVNDLNIPVFLKNFFRSYPKVTAGFSMAAYSVNIFSFFFGLLRWNEIPVTAKALAINSAILATTRAFSSAVAWKACKAFKQSFPNLSTADGIMIREIKSIDFVAALSKGRTVEEVLTELGVAAGEVPGAAADASAAGTRWLSFVRISSTVAKIATTLAMGVALGFQIYFTVHDFGEDQTAAVKALDIIQDICCAGCLIIGVGEFIGFGELFSAIAPPAACVLLIVGIVVSIVSLFVHRKEPKSPVEEFIDNRCVKFVNMLAMPDSDWLIQHTGTADV